MDLNELFFRHQIALIGADRAGDREVRRRFGAQANCLAGQIGTLQQRLGARATPLARAVAA